MTITDEQIEQAKQSTRYTGKPVHEHPDCIRIAAEWLSAQRRIKQPTSREHGLKHIIEAWAGRYVSHFDVEVAATLLGLQGRYPYYDISSRLTRPRLTRLEGIGEAMKHRGYLASPWHVDVYARPEESDGKDS